MNCPKCEIRRNYKDHMVSRYDCGSYSNQGVFKQSDKCRVYQLENRISVLEAALKPFSEMAEAYHDWDLRDYPEIVHRHYSIKHGSLFRITVGDFHRAKAALTPPAFDSSPLSPQPAPRDGRKQDALNRIL